MCKELQRIDPLGFSVAREELFIKAYVPFGVDPRGGLSWGPLYGAVDGVVVEVFVDVATIAGDPRVWAPAVNVSTKWVRGVREEIHGWLRDAFLWGAEWAAVWADVVTFPSKEMFELVDSGVGAAFGGNTEEAQTCIVVWSGKCGGCYAYTFSGPQGEGECRWGGDVGGVSWVKIGDGGPSAWAAFIRKGR